MEAPPNAPVTVNVYNMAWTNDYTSRLGLGVFHSGVEVYGREYAYGGHPFPMTGIFEINPRQASDMGDSFVFKESILLGTTDFTARDVSAILEQLGSDFPGDKYHLLRKNCNHFTEAFAKLLCGKSPPSWVNRLATVSAFLPLVERALPREWLTPVPLQTAIERLARDNPEQAAQIQAYYEATVNSNGTAGASGSASNSNSNSNSNSAQRDGRRSSASASSSSSLRSTASSPSVSANASKDMERERDSRRSPGAAAAASGGRRDEPDSSSSTLSLDGAHSSQSQC